MTTGNSTPHLNEGEMEGKNEGMRLARDAYLSWMAEMRIDETLEEYHKKVFGIKAFLFNFASSLLALIVFYVLLG